MVVAEAETAVVAETVAADNGLEVMAAAVTEVEEAMAAAAAAVANKRVNAFSV